jgi:hypothetical protein
VMKKRTSAVVSVPKLTVPPPLTVDVDFATPRKEEEPPEEDSFFAALVKKVETFFASKPEADQDQEDDTHDRDDTHRVVPKEEDELVRLQKERRCVACSKNPRNTVLLNCSHVALCSECARESKKCPLCRDAFSWTNVQEIYFV